jgi:hypothetical protein
MALLPYYFAAMTMQSENFAYLDGAKALVRFTETNDGGAVCDDIGGITKIVTTVTGADTKPEANIKAWGKGNKQPWEREQLIMDNNIVGELIKTKRDIILGGGLQAYREVYTNGEKTMDLVETPKAAQDFFDAIDIDDYLLTAANNFVKHANIFTELVRESTSDLIASIKAHESRHIRAEQQDSASGKIKNYFWCGNWGSSRKEIGRKWPVKRVPNYDGEEAKQKIFMLHTGDSILTDEYYYIPTWWGGKSWIEVSNDIPIFHRSNLQHGYSIRFHVEIPKDYFYSSSTSDQTADQRKQSLANAQTARQTFLDNLNKFLAGATNAGRTVVTEYEINKAAGKEFPGIKITPINYDIKDKALLDLFEKSNQANISGQGIHPTLAAIETAGKLSSGSEIRNAYLMYTALKTPAARRILLKPIEMIHRINKWGDGIKWTFRDIEVTKLDDNPQAKQDVLIA